MSAFSIYDLSPKDDVWRIGPQHPELMPGEVHIWRAHQDVADGLSHSLLSDEEWERADRFRFPKDRNRFICRRTILRVLSGMYLNQDPGVISLGQSPFGKPYLSDVHLNGSFEFSLSSSEGLLLLVFSRDTAVGVDVEWIRKDFEFQDIAGRFFTPAENRMIKDSPPEDRLRNFFTIWTRKEAMLKTVGTGLFTHPMTDVDVLSGLIYDRSEKQNRISDTLSVHSFVPSDRYTASVSRMAGDFRCRFFQFRH